MGRRPFIAIPFLLALAGCSTSVSVVPRDDLPPLDHECRPILLQPTQVPERATLKVADVSVRQGAVRLFAELDGALSRLHAELRGVGADAYRLVRVRKPGFWYDGWRLEAEAFRFAPPWPRRALDEAAACATLDTLGPDADPIAGIWACHGVVARLDPESRHAREHLLPSYRLAILPADLDPDYDHAAFVLESSLPTFAPGDVKALVRSTAVPGRYDLHWWDEAFVASDLTVDLADTSRIVLEITAADGMDGSIESRRRVCLERVRPPGTGTAAPYRPTGGELQGTGVLVREDGCVATSALGLCEQSEPIVTFPRIDGCYRAKVAIIDTLSSLAILRLEDFVYGDAFTGPLPYRLDNTVAPGKEIDASVAGYPFSPLLGSGLSEPLAVRISAADTALVALWTDWSVPSGYIGAPVVTAAGDLVAIVILPTDDPTDFTRFWHSTFLGSSLSWAYGIERVNALLARIPPTTPPPVPPPVGTAETEGGDRSRAALPYTALVTVR